MTMQVEEVKKEGLAHSYVVTLAANDVEAAVEKRLVEVGKKSKIKGFRPGKAPLAIIRQNYGESVRAEVLEDKVTECMGKALDERKIRPAMRPKVEVVSFGEGKDLSFKMDLEALPDVTPMDFAKLSFTRQVADVEDKAIDETIERVAKSMHQPTAITEKRAAKMGDTVKIDFDGTVDGQRRDGMKAEGHVLELGTHSFIDTFEDQIAGMKVGDKKDIKVTFPTDYHAKDLSGKAAVFAVTLHEIREQGPVEINDATAKEIGFPSLEKLRERIKTDISNNYANISRTVLKRELMDKLSDAHDFVLPQSMIEAEFGSIWAELQKEKAQGHLPEDDKNKSEDELKAEYRGIAERRIRLGLLLAEVAQKNKIEVAEIELRNAMIAEARRYPGQEDAVIRYYTQTEGAIERLRAPILEEKVVDFILAQAKIDEKKIAADALMKLPDLD